MFYQDRDSQKTQWIDRCVEELRNDTWVLPALKHIKEICMLFYEVSYPLSRTAKVMQPDNLLKHQINLHIKM